MASLASCAVCERGRVCVRERCSNRRVRERAEAGHERVYKSLYQLIQERKTKQTKMCSSVTGRLWFFTDHPFREDHPQKEILRALKAKCCEEELDFKAVVMNGVVLTVERGNLGLRINGELISASKSSNPMDAE